MEPQDNHSTAEPAVNTSGIALQERQWAMFAHLSALVGAIVSAGWGFSFACFVGPLVIWLLKKETMPFAGEQAREALNFNITVAIAFVALMLLTWLTLGLGALIAIPLYLIIALAWLVLTIIAAIKANDGISYRYPFALRLIK